MIDQVKNCPFCNTVSKKIIEGKSSFAIFDNFPVTKGHTLIIPKRHCENYFELTLEEQGDCIALLNKTKKIIQMSHNPAGFNVGININEAAGQTILHAHIHLIPRYGGDVERPRGGVRGVIPDRQDY